MKPGLPRMQGYTESLASRRYKYMIGAPRAIRDEDSLLVGCNGKPKLERHLISTVG